MNVANSSRNWKVTNSIGQLDSLPSSAARRLNVSRWPKCPELDTVRGYSKGDGARSGNLTLPRLVHEPSQLDEAQRLASDGAKRETEAVMSQ